MSAISYEEGQCRSEQHHQQSAAVGQVNGGRWRGFDGGGEVEGVGLRLLRGRG